MGYRVVIGRHKVLFQHLFEGTEEDLKGSQGSWPQAIYLTCDPNMSAIYSTKMSSFHVVFRSSCHKGHDQTDNKPILNKRNKNTFTVFHQNICGLLNKKEELLNSLMKHSPQIICISEHHLNDEELEGITLHSYTLGAKFCR